MGTLGSLPEGAVALATEGVGSLRPSGTSLKEGGGKTEKSPSYSTGFVSGNVKLHSAGDLAAAQAAGADVNMLGRAVYDGLDALHIGLPGTIGASVGVADLNAESHVLITKLTLCHFLKHLLACV